MVFQTLASWIQFIIIVMCPRKPVKVAVALAIFQTLDLTLLLFSYLSTFTPLPRLHQAGQYLHVPTYAPAWETLPELILGTTFLQT